MTACYYRNGTATSSDFSPCSSDASNPLSTVCCASWDTCLPNGLCQSTIDKAIWRETCTKQNWDEGGCQELCSNEREAERDEMIKVTSCDGTNNASSITWCCGDNGDACCTAGSGVARYTIASHFGDPIPTLAPSFSQNSSISTPSASTQTAAAASGNMANTGDGGPSTDGGLSTGAKAGIGIGASLGALALIALGVFIYKALQWRKSARTTAPPSNYPDEYRYASAEAHGYQPDVKLAQLPGMESEVHELSGSRDASELCLSLPSVTKVSSPPK